MQSSPTNLKQAFYAAMLPNQMGTNVVLDFQIGIINYPKIRYTYTYMYQEKDSIIQLVL